MQKTKVAAQAGQTSSFRVDLEDRHSPADGETSRHGKAPVLCQHSRLPKWLARYFVKRQSLVRRCHGNIGLLLVVSGENDRVLDAATAIG